MRRLLVLRPEPGASATVKRAQALGLDALAVPLFEAEPIAWKAPRPGGFEGLLLTSGNAVRYGGGQLQELRGLPVYAVGEATAQLAREAGFKVAAVGDAGIDRLLSSIEPGLKLLHLCGQDRQERGETSQEVASLPVYRSRVLSPPNLSMARGAIALIHSPSAGRRFAQLVQERASTAVAAISPAAARAVGSGWEWVRHADRPSDEALLALAASLCNNSSPQ